MARRALPTTAAALTAAAALLLTGCGGGDKSSSGDIKGADTGNGSPSASASASASAVADRPDVSLPKDLKLVFDFDTPSDTDRVAALGDAENYIRAINHGVTQQDPNDPAYQYYSAGDAARYANSQIKTYVKGGWTLTGTDRYYQAETSDGGASKSVKLTRVTFCENQAKAYGKEVKSGKVLYTKESLGSYLKFNILMASTKASPVWKAQSVTVTGKAKECQE
ncbi:hypothetical protein [Streptomyces sp. NBC_00474]|uniref:hypothetical protein n=1 Tax=Streptomyces sp. NBC_00474 TaxID=2975754 RepID=UPI0022578006|nr:hypothetical protein [Streptomyces sp. NBC_00474]MCX5050292.1 hypothetical protein [Streptomyces sp. NBC_00474]